MSTALDLSTPFDANTKPPAPPAAAKTDKTLVGLLLDRSGSMASVKPATIGACNEYINTLKDDKSILFTFVMFCGRSTDRVVVRTPIAEVQTITETQYMPESGGNTPLYDSTAMLIHGLEQQAKDLGGNPKVIVAIQTDGYENASKEHDRASISALVEAKKKDGWQFNFLGAGLGAEAYRQSANLGLGRAETVSYDHKDAEKSRSIFRDTARNTTMYASGMSVGTTYDSRQKLAAGDTEEEKAAGKLVGSLKEVKAASKRTSRSA